MDWEGRCEKNLLTICILGNFARQLYWIKFRIVGPSRASNGKVFAPVELEFTSLRVVTKQEGQSFHLPSKSPRRRRIQQEVTGSQMRLA